MLALPRCVYIGVFLYFRDRIGLFDHAVIFGLGRGFHPGFLVGYLQNATLLQKEIGQEFVLCYKTYYI